MFAAFESGVQFTRVITLEFLMWITLVVYKSQTFSVLTRSYNVSPLLRMKLERRIKELLLTQLLSQTKWMFNVVVRVRNVSFG